MKFDTIIIGGGLAGLICGIRLAENNQRCALITSGKSALYFSSGSFDMLGYLSNYDTVISPLDAITELMIQKPNHPYSKLGIKKIESFAMEATILLQNAGISMDGDIKNNHFRLTPMGIWKPTWLTLNGMAISREDKQSSWKKVVICNLNGFLDFPHQMIAEELRNTGIETDIQILNVTFLDNIKQTSTEIRSTSITKLLVEDKNLKELANAINRMGNDYDAILLPNVFYTLSDNTFVRLKEMVLDKHLLLTPTMPPSVPGIEIENMLTDHFKKLGGKVFLGDSVLKGEIKDDIVTKIYTSNHEDIPFVGNNYVLATGCFFSKGLVSRNTSVYEPIFDCEVDFVKKREEWYSKNLFDKQAYLAFGVKTTSDFNAMVKGKVINNLYAIGSILSGFDPIEESSGAGVAMFTGLEAANQILNK